MGDKTLFFNEWLSLRIKDGWYSYVHEERCDGKIVAILVYTTTADGKGLAKILGRYEGNPLRKDKLTLCSITGGKEKGLTLIETAILEMHEEAGYDVIEDELEYLGIVEPYKAADTQVHLYSYNATGKENEREIKSKGDGSKGEEGAYCEWITIDDAYKSTDSVLHSLIARYCGKCAKDFNMWLAQGEVK